MIVISGIVTASLSRRSGSLESFDTASRIASYVAIAALHTFTEVRNEKATWTKFGAIVVVGVVLLVAVIWLLGKSADILL